MPSKADKMFEELGYKQVNDLFKTDDLFVTENRIIYETISFHAPIYIIFDLEKQWVIKYAYPFESYVWFKLDELKAVHEKMKELGWI